MSFIADLVQIAGLIAIPVGFIAIWRELQKIRQDTRPGRRSEETISIKLTPELQEMNLDYCVMHVRDGTSQGEMVLRKKEIPMKPEDGNRYSAAVEYYERLGFEFKCFTKYENHNERKVKEALERANLRSVDLEKERKRVWFLLPDSMEYEKYTDVVDEPSGAYNQYYRPS